jgi:hypothetical protein
LSKRVVLFILLVSLGQFVEAQTAAPNVFDVLPYSTIFPTGPFAGTLFGATSYQGPNCSLQASAATATRPFCGPYFKSPSNFTTEPGIFGLASSLNGSIAVALSVIPLASPASGVITRTDPTTGAELPSSISLGPIFTERAETIGRHKFYVGVSNQDFHFATLNGKSISPATMLQTQPSLTSVYLNGSPLPTLPATVNVQMDVRLSQNVAFLTYGVTDRIDVSVGLPLVHSAVSSATSNGVSYVGDGLNGNGTGNCWCVGTFTPAMAPVNGSGLTTSQVGFVRKAQTGFGDMLLRFKGNVFEGKQIAGDKVALALGADLRLPTGDDTNFLGTGAVAVKPFAALSLYTKEWNGVVFSPHLNVGWQFAGSSILGGTITGTPVTVGGVPGYSAPPFTSSKGTLPDVFSWAVGSEVALGRHNTVVVDFLGNQIGWINGIQNMKTESVQALAPQGTTGKVTPQTVSGLVSAGLVSFGQYSGAFGYKARIIGNLVATFNLLVRFDNNGLTARTTPLYGLSYTFF